MLSNILAVRYRVVEDLLNVTITTFVLHAAMFLLSFIVALVAIMMASKPALYGIQTSRIH